MLLPWLGKSICSCGWTGPVFTLDNNAATSDPAELPTDEYGLTQWDNGHKPDVDPGLPYNHQFNIEVTTHHRMICPGSWYERMLCSCGWTGPVFTNDQNIPTKTPPHLLDDDYYGLPIWNAKLGEPEVLLGLVNRSTHHIPDPNLPYTYEFAKHVFSCHRIHCHHPCHPKPDSSA